MDRLEYHDTGIPQFIEYFGDKFDGMSTRDAYEEYLKFWTGKHAAIAGFSRVVTKVGHYNIVDKTICKVKRRLFVKG